MRRVLAVAMTLTAVRASADGPKQASLSWVRLPGAEECIGAQALAKAVEERVGRDVFASPAKSEIAIEGRVEKVKSGYRATIVATGSDGKKLGARELVTDDKSCRALDESIVLVISATVDPDAEAPKPAPSATAAAPPPPPPPITIVERVPVVERITVERPSPWAWGVRLGGVATIGALPSIAPGARIAARVEHRALVPLEVDVTALASAGDRSGRGATLSHYGAGLAACPSLLSGSVLGAHACGGFALSLLRANGFGFDVIYERTRILADVVARLGVDLRLIGPWFAAVALEGRAALLRPRLLWTRADGTSEVLYQPPVASAALEVAVGVHFP